MEPPVPDGANFHTPPTVLDLNSPAESPAAGLKPPPPRVQKPTRWCRVQKGRTRADAGVHDSWAEAQAATMGAPSAVYKGFITMEAAQAFVDQAFVLPTKPAPLGKRWFAPVSYTHLTLPTIYSV